MALQAFDYSIEMSSDSISDPAGAVHSGSVAEVHGVSAEGLQELPQTHHQGPHRVNHRPCLTL